MSKKYCGPACIAENIGIMKRLPVTLLQPLIIMALSAQILYTAP